LQMKGVCTSPVAVSCRFEERKLSFFVIFPYWVRCSAFFLVSCGFFEKEGTPVRLAVFPAFVRFIFSLEPAFLPADSSPFLVFASGLPLVRVVCFQSKLESGRIRPFPLSLKYEFQLGGLSPPLPFIFSSSVLTNALIYQCSAINRRSEFFCTYSLPTRQGLEGCPKNLSLPLGWFFCTFPLKTSSPDEYQRLLEFLSSFCPRFASRFDLTPFLSPGFFVVFPR